MDKKAVWQLSEAAIWPPDVSRFRGQSPVSSFKDTLLEKIIGSVIFATRKLTTAEHKNLLKIYLKQSFEYSMWGELQMDNCQRGNVN